MLIHVGLTALSPSPSPPRGTTDCSYCGSSTTWVTKHNVLQEQTNEMNIRLSHTFNCSMTAHWMKLNACIWLRAQWMTCNWELWRTHHLHRSILFPLSEHIESHIWRPRNHDAHRSEDRYAHVVPKKQSTNQITSTASKPQVEKTSSTPIKHQCPYGFDYLG